MFKHKIDEIMKSKNVTKKDLAEHFGISAQSMSNKFSRKSFSAKDLIRILEFLDCKLVIVPKPDTEIILTPKDFD